MIATAKKFHATFLSGWWRWPREHFCVYAGHAPDRLKPIRAPFGTYYADPFPWTHAGRTWLFLEAFSYARNRGQIVALPLDPNLRPAGAALPLNLPDNVHASYPCIFSVGGEILLIPETGGLGTVDLYTCERFPDRWRLRRRLLDRIDAVDATPLFHAGRWWLFTAVRHHPADGGRRSLAIHSTADLFHGRWEPHPCNASRRHGESPFSFGRPAGPFVPALDGGWLRPMQASRQYYGESSQLMQLETLTPTAFSEKPCAEPHPLRALCRRMSPHHVATNGGVIACDIRDRFRIDRPDG
jgi:hypothetical protein